MARDDWGASWSRDGERLVFLSDRDGAQRMYVMAARGGDAKRVTTEAAARAVEEQPRWSPDGATLGYLRGEGTALSVVVVDVARGTTRTITPAGQADHDFAWSPDGAHLAVIRHGDPKARAAATITFVRVSDGVAIASVATDATLVRWIAP